MCVCFSVHRSDIEPTLSRARDDLHPTSVPDVGQTSFRCQSNLGPMSPVDIEPWWVRPRFDGGYDLGPSLDRLWIKVGWRSKHTGTGRGRGTNADTLVGKYSELNTVITGRMCFRSEYRKYEYSSAWVVSQVNTVNMERISSKSKYSEYVSPN